MSFKAKDLSYEANEPAFLRRLRAGVTSGDSDRHERPIARPKRLKKDDDEEDAPTYVLEESGESMSKAQYEAMQKSKQRGDDVDGPQSQANAESQEESEDHPDAKNKQESNEIGQYQRKRKAGKVVGHPDEHESLPTGDGEEHPKKAAKKSAKKAKGLKLSFDDD